MTNAPRADLPIEVSSNLDSSGNYTSAWIDSADILSVRVVYYSGVRAIGIAIDESSDETNLITTPPTNPVPATYSGVANFVVSARYFRLNISGGGAAAAFWASIRNVT